MPVSISEITQEQKDIVLSFVNIIEELKKEPDNQIVTISFEKLEQVLAPEQKRFAQDIRSINPADYGVKIEFLGIEPVPGNLVTIKGQSYAWEGEKKHIATQYLPHEVYEAYRKMNEAMKNDIKSWLFAKSAYRSPAYQLLAFIYWLQKHNFNIVETLRHSSLPGYSEHSYAPRQATDFMTKDGIIWGDKICFNDTGEYKWLLKNAKSFGFELSYPENNKQGMIFEPWHWRYEGH